MDIEEVYNNIGKEVEMLHWTKPYIEVDGQLPEMCHDWLDDAKNIRICGVYKFHAHIFHMVGNNRYEYWIHPQHMRLKVATQ